MADPRQFELEDLVNRPGTYFNPQTEMLVTVDDSPVVDTEMFEDLEGSDWILISDDSAIDENRRDELLERFQVRHQPDTLSHDEDDEDEVDELEPDEDDYEPE
jgi:hypothetical protein